MDASPPSNVIRLDDVRRARAAEAQEIGALRTACVLRYLRLVKLGAQGEYLNYFRVAETMLPWWKDRSYPGHGMLTLYGFAAESMAVLEQQLGLPSLAAD